jgi:hypothetical protein
MYETVHTHISFYTSTCMLYKMRVQSYTTLYIITKNYVVS